MGSCGGPNIRRGAPSEKCCLRKEDASSDALARDLACTSLAIKGAGADPGDLRGLNPREEQAVEITAVVVL